LCFHLKLGVHTLRATSKMGCIRLGVHAQCMRFSAHSESAAFSANDGMLPPFNFLQPECLA
jgi:hypothetical protein